MWPTNVPLVCYMFNSKRLSAFSLLEMAIVLAIMGVMVGVSLPLLIGNKSVDKRRTTAKHLDLVMEALKVFGTHHHRLPCPATQNSEGKALQSCDAHASGYVPYKALGISASVAHDGYGHPLRYALDPLYTLPNPGSPGDEGGALKVLDEKNTPVLDPTQNKHDRIVVVLVAEGEAYGIPSSAAEHGNLASDLTFYDYPYTLGSFRHSVRWTTRNTVLPQQAPSLGFQDIDDPNK
jgi:type II secretory pathway pseudopilin PulG